ncbi:hypothetical protein [Pontiella sulfatireligans]|uniref:Uncharacterized protein n=1 Tax=Pontiella sulfatireligans TaxID=2750658 RepID=A0A6C2UT13_9BACT|nr:hypothetical protein [Pontiella sulfatireligans]VGO22357.1 hypothetical protein SCARR_04440 [Pontiella sulfatireligans]
MRNEFAVLPKWVINLFLWIGLAASIAVRSLMLLNRANPEAAVWVWRFAMFSYCIFFGYRLIVGRRRHHVVTRHDLIQRIGEAEQLDPKTREATVYILRSIVCSKELFNYAFICALSVIALVLDFFAN